MVQSHSTLIKKYNAPSAAFLGLTPVPFAYWLKVRLEESNLNVAFGADHGAYRRETWALLPGLF